MLSPETQPEPQDRSKFKLPSQLAQMSNNTLPIKIQLISFFLFPEDYDCVICHEDFIIGETCRGILDCGCANFCLQCILEYLPTKSVCPVCEADVTGKELDFELVTI